MRWLILLGVAIVATWFVYQAVFQGASNVTPSGTPSPTSQLSTTKSEYTQALTRAKDWQPNATLTRVYRIFDGTLTPETPLPLVYSFSSLAEPSQAYEVSITKDDIKEKKTGKQPFELNFIPIDTGEWQIDPEAALSIAGQEGGSRFIEQHLAGYKLLQQLSKNAGHQLQWYFRYDAGDGTHMRLELFVNAETGALDSKKESVV